MQTELLSVVKIVCVSVYGGKRDENAEIFIFSRQCKTRTKQQIYRIYIDTKHQQTININTATAVIVWTTENGIENRKERKWNGMRARR